MIGRYIDISKGGDNRRSVETRPTRRATPTHRGILWAAVGIAAVFVLTLSSGCGLGGGPRPRNGYSPTTGLVPFLGLDDLGTHSYGFGLGEGSGIVYTQRGGSIDVDHVRGAADITKHAYDLSYAALTQGKTTFSLSPPFEFYTNRVEFEYPETWGTLSEEAQRAIAHEVSLQVAQTVGYNSTLYHEMLTWLGTRFLLVPEFYSAFSWEDVYSNLLGTHLAVRALQDPAGDYDQAMTRLLKAELEHLGVVSKDEAIRATNSVKGQWFTQGLLFPEISRRHLDIGLDDGYVTPALIPGVSEAEPLDYPAPVLDALDTYGFTMRYTIDSGHRADRTMRDIAGADGPIEPLKHYPAIMAYIEDEAIRVYGHDIGQ